MGYICEWYYCDPEKNIDCIGMKYGHPSHPLYDDIHMERFFSFLGGRWKEVHVYCLEITPVEAMVRLRKDEERIVDAFANVKNTGVVIEEIEETPKPKPRPRPKRKSKPLMLCWYKRDLEFEEFLETNIEEDKKGGRRLEEEVLAAELPENLLGMFNVVGDICDEGGVVVDGAVEGEGDQSVHALEEVEIQNEDLLPHADSNTRERVQSTIIEEPMEDAEYRAFFDDIYIGDNCSLNNTSGDEGEESLKNDSAKPSDIEGTHSGTVGRDETA